MEHKAFVFDYDRCKQELVPIIEAALQRKSADLLRSFISANFASLRSPYDGEPLSSAWTNLLEVGDVHELGDFALTKYYNPNEDIGLGRSWESTQEEIRINGMDPMMVLGEVIGPLDSPFDPGKIGSYFQSLQDVVRGSDSLERVMSPSNPRIQQVHEMFATAIQAGRGLYVTF